MNISEVKRILIIGAGTMGRQIALQCAMYNYNVVIYDTSLAILNNGLEKIKSYAYGEPPDLCRPHIRLNIEKPDEVINRIAITDDAKQAAQDVDLLIESAPESVEVKSQIFASFNQYCPSRTIFTSNTSSLKPSQIAGTTGRPDKFAALHFHHVVAICNLVDIMPAPLTSPKTINLLKHFATNIGQTYHEFHEEHPGYVANSLLGTWAGKALELVVNGVATPEEVDRDWMIVSKMKFGPFAFFDFVGIDVIYDVTMNSPKYTEQEKTLRAALFKRYVKKGWLGAKSGRGFYSYPNPRYLDEDFLRN